MSLKRLEEYLDKLETLRKHDEALGEIASLQDRLTANKDQLEEVQDELSKHKDLRIQFAGEEITWEDFERRVREQTQKAYREEIDAGIKRGMNEAFRANVQATINNAKQEE